MTGDLDHFDQRILFDHRNALEERTTFDVSDLFLSLLETAWTVAVSFEGIINVVEDVQNYTFGSKHGSRWRKKTVSRCCKGT